MHVCKIPLQKTGPSNALFGDLLLAASFVEHVAARQADAGSGIKDVTSTYYAKLVLGNACGVGRALFFEATDA